jgi:MFS family permease
MSLPLLPRRAPATVSVDVAPAQVARFERRRFMQLFAGLASCTVVGTVYSFGILADRLKAQFALSQDDLTTITTFGYVFALFNLPAGILFDKFGPRTVNAVAFTVLAIGFALFALTFQGVLPGSTASLSAIYVLCCWPAGFLDTGTLMPNLFRFPLNRGDVVIIQKTFMGLGATIFTVCYMGFFGGSNVAAYCWFIAAACVVLGTGAVAAITMPASGTDVLSQEELEDVTAAVNAADNDGDADGSRGAHEDALEKVLVHTRRAPTAALTVGFVLLGVMLTYLLAVSGLYRFHVLGADTTPGTDTAIAAVTLAILVCFAALPLVAARDAAASTIARDDSAVNETTTLIGSDEPAAERKPFFARCRPFDTTLMASTRTLDFWLLWCALFVMWGTGAVVSANSAQIYRAANDNVFDAQTNNVYVAIGGIGSACGRIVAGLLERFCPQKSITLFLALPCAIATASLLGFVLLPPSMIAVSFFLQPAAYGMSWAFAILSMRMMYRVDLGTHYGALFTSGMVSITCFNRFLFGPFFDAEARRQGNYPHCSGVRCYALPLLLIAALNVAAGGAAYVVHRRWMRRHEEVEVVVAE